ncbi:SufD family Fe-S cluster assembly protein [Candidatus Microgenomates bacterium]|nr:SufD family Fe-S cluster assembly protein [Candidatus Microgenomates bacterium]
MKNLKITVKKGEEKVIPIVWTDGQDQELTIEASLVGEGASLNILGVVLGDEDRQFILHTNIYHQAPKTKSRVNIRGVLHDHAQFDNEGLIHIAKGAKGADGFFTARVLLFDEAKGRSIPSLEIDENEVKAGHAATTGQVDQTMLFYLQSRGLSEKKAERLIVSGFFEPIIKELSENQQVSIKEKINEKL